MSKLRLLAARGALVVSGVALVRCQPSFNPTVPGPTGTETTPPLSAPPAATTASASSPKYPAEPKGPPPVAPPDGQGLSVKLQRYIVVDQFGYPTRRTKVAVLVDPVLGWNADDGYVPGAELEVRKWSDGAVVHKGPSTLWNGGSVDDTSGDRGAWFDFSALTTPGLYYVFDAKNAVRSHPFEIGDDVYRRVLKTAMRMFYFNRANVE